MAAKSLASESDSQHFWFTTEIQHMMHGFGDCAKPLFESAALIEGIVYKQMILLLQQVEGVALQRGVKLIGLEDFIFLLRKDKGKLKRLYQYIEFKDIKTAAVKGLSIEETEAEATTIAELEKQGPPRRRIKTFTEFLSVIDPTGELAAYIDNTTDDEIKLARKIRAELMTRHMDSKEYAEYCEARQASFAPRYKTQKFKEWILTDSIIDLKLNPFAQEVLCYMAYETVAQIVDMALIVRRDRKAFDPFTQQMSAVTYDPTGDSSDAGQLVRASKMSTLSAQAIQPCDIQEAVRRYYQPIGPFNDFSKSPLILSSNYLLCT